MSTFTKQLGEDGYRLEFVLSNSQISLSGSREATRLEMTGNTRHLILVAVDLLRQAPSLAEVAACSYFSLGACDCRLCLGLPVGWEFLPRNAGPFEGT